MSSVEYDAEIAQELLESIIAGNNEVNQIVDEIKLLQSDQ